MNDTTPNHPTETSWSTMAKVLHWVIAAMIVVQVVLAQLAKRAAESDNSLERLALLANHKSLGLTVLLLVIVRIGWRLSHRPPALPLSAARWQRVASHLSHAGLYFLMLALPLSGWIMAATSAYGISWFNLFEVPRILSANHDLHELWEEIHEVLGYVLLVVVVVHVAAAAFHHLIVKDTVLKRMSSRLSVGLFVVLLVGLVWLLTPGSNPSNSASSSDATASTAAPASGAAGTEATLIQTTAELWDIDYEQSFIRFTGEQAGAAFSGLWTEWRADMRFNTETTALLFEVEIDVDKANSDDEERDSTLKDSDWFDVVNYPVARFVLDAATHNNDGSYTGVGRLIIKDSSTPTEFTFSLDQSNGLRTLTGRARLDRLALNIGTGEWADTSWVGQYVDVDVRVVTR